VDAEYSHQIFERTECPGVNIRGPEAGGLGEGLTASYRIKDNVAEYYTALQAQWTLVNMFP
jgi:hypothetical protein